MTSKTELHRQLDDYVNSEECNDAVWNDFTSKIENVDFLRSHRDWVEQNSWGYGDRAFHYMWYLLLKDDILNRRSPSFIEIGVYKGQVVSLWALIARQLNRQAAITAISPLEGERPWSILTLKVSLGKLKRAIIRSLSQLGLGRIASLFGRSAQWTSSLVNRSLIKDAEVRSSNYYERIDYRNCIETIFDKFGLSKSNFELIKGQSQDERVKRQLAGRAFDVVYIDGDHRFEAVVADLEFYAPLVKSGGYLVMDDASCGLPGTVFKKGHQSVSQAVDRWDAAGFTNVLNVGHNRVYRRDA